MGAATRSRRWGQQRASQTRVLRAAGQPDAHTTRRWPARRAYYAPLASQPRLWSTSCDWSLSLHVAVGAWDGWESRLHSLVQDDQESSCACAGMCHQLAGTHAQGCADSQLSQPGAATVRSSMRTPVPPSSRPSYDACSGTVRHTDCRGQGASPSRVHACGREWAGMEARQPAAGGGQGGEGGAAAAALAMAPTSAGRFARALDDPPPHCHAWNGMCAPFHLDINCARACVSPAVRRCSTPATPATHSTDALHVDGWTRLLAEMASSRGADASTAQCLRSGRSQLEPPNPED
eukprot:352662-Chlamydomonas_euryale.AAC.4